MELHLPHYANAILCTSNGHMHTMTRRCACKSGHPPGPHWAPRYRAQMQLQNERWKTHVHQASCRALSWGV